MKSAGIGFEEGKPCYCPACLVLHPLKADKHGNPFFRCSMCAYTVFMGTGHAYIGWMVQQGVIGKNPAGWKKAVQTGTSKLTVARFARRKAKEPAEA